MLSLKAQNQHFLANSKVNLGFEHDIRRAIDSPLKILQDICDPSREKGRVGGHIVKFTFSAF